MLNLFSLGVPCCILFLLAACSLMFAASRTQPFLKNLRGLHMNLAKLLPVTHMYLEQFDSVTSGKKSFTKVFLRCGAMHATPWHVK